MFLSDFVLNAINHWKLIRTLMCMGILKMVDILTKISTADKDRCSPRLSFKKHTSSHSSTYLYLIYIIYNIYIIYFILYMHIILYYIILIFIYIILFLTVLRIFKKSPTTPELFYFQTNPAVKFFY